VPQMSESCSECGGAKCLLRWLPRSRVKIRTDAVNQGGRKRMRKGGERTAYDHEGGKSAVAFSGSRRQAACPNRTIERRIREPSSRGEHRSAR
jgi:hypothetical protein